MSKKYFFVFLMMFSTSVFAELDIGNVINVVKKVVENANTAKGDAAKGDAPKAETAKGETVDKEYISSSDPNWKQHPEGAICTVKLRQEGYNSKELMTVKFGWNEQGFFYAERIAKNGVSATAETAQYYFLQNGKRYLRYDDNKLIFNRASVYGSTDKALDQSTRGALLRGRDYFWLDNRYGQQIGPEVMFYHLGDFNPDQDWEIVQPIANTAGGYKTLCHVDAAQANAGPYLIKFDQASQKKLKVDSIKWSYDTTIRKNIAEVELTALASMSCGAASKVAYRKLMVKDPKGYKLGVVPRLSDIPVPEKGDKLKFTIEVYDNKIPEGSSFEFSKLECD